MPKLNGRVPKFRHHKSTGRGYVVIGGRTIYLGPYRSDQTRERYRRLIAEWIAGGCSTIPSQHTTGSTPTNGTTVRIKDLVLAYWRHAKSYYRLPNGSPSTELQSFRQPLRVLRELYGMMPAVDFSPKRLKAVRSVMAAKGWSRPYINNQIGRLKRVFRWGVESEMMPPSVYQGLLAVQPLKKNRSGDIRETEPVKPVDESHVHAVLPFLPPRVAAMVRLQLLTGMRPAEVTSMSWQEIDMSQSSWVYSPGHHKTAHHGKARHIPLGPQAQLLLRTYLKQDVTGPVFSPAASEIERRSSAHTKRKTPLNQGNGPGYSKRVREGTAAQRSPQEMYSVASYRRAIERGCEKAFPLLDPLARREDETLARWKAQLTVDQRREITALRKKARFHPHQLRHTAAYRIRRDHGLEAAQAVLGHSNVRMTEHYAAIDGTKAAAVMQECG